MCAAQRSWIEREFPAFDAGPDGFPRPGQVIRYFRQKKLKANGKPWTQRDLAQVLGKRELAVREMELAVQSFLSAEKLLKKLPSYMGGGILIGLGRSVAIQTQDTQGRLIALHTLDKAANILRVYPLPDGNQHYLEIELDRYHIDKSAAFLDVGFPREALRELSYVDSFSNNQRRAALISVLQAQAYFSLGKYVEACSIAEETLSIIEPIHSVVNYKHIKTLHSQLKLTNFGDNPEVARIGMMIHQIYLRWHAKNGEGKQL